MFNFTLENILSIINPSKGFDEHHYSARSILIRKQGEKEGLSFQRRYIGREGHKFLSDSTGRYITKEMLASEIVELKIKRVNIRDIIVKAGINMYQTESDVEFIIEN